MHSNRDKILNLQIFHNCNQSNPPFHSIIILEHLSRSNARETWNYDHSLPSSADIQNEWHYTSIPLAQVANSV